MHRPRRLMDQVLGPPLTLRQPSGEVRDGVGSLVAARGVTSPVVVDLEGVGVSRFVRRRPGVSARLAVG